MFGMFILVRRSMLAYICASRSPRENLINDVTFKTATPRSELKMVTTTKILHGLAPLPLLLVSLLLFGGVIALGEAARKSYTALRTADHQIWVRSVLRSLLYIVS